VTLPGDQAPPLLPPSACARSTFNLSSVPTEVLRHCKQLGYSDRQVAKFLGSNELAVRRLRQDASISPFVKQIDTVAAEFPAFTNYH
jgi:carbamoyl-phosphate synthase/aspartate carbamoyltransferase